MAAIACSGGAGIGQREAIIKPDAMADDLAGEAVVLVAFRVSGWSHIGGLS
jgi:hypothetical protein